jgi:hypothetical protein
MDRKCFIRHVAVGAALAPSAAFALTGGARQRKEIEVTVHMDPG